MGGESLAHPNKAQVENIVLIILIKLVMESRYIWSEFSKIVIIVSFGCCLTYPSLCPARWVFVRNASRSSMRRTNAPTPTCSRNSQRGIQRWWPVISTTATRGQDKHVYRLSKRLTGLFFSLPVNRKKLWGRRVRARRTAMKRWRSRTEKKKLQAKQKHRWRRDCITVHLYFRLL